MKGFFKYFLFFLILVVVVVLDSCFFKEIFILKHLRLSVLFCLYLSFFAKGEMALLISVIPGILLDLFGLTFPYFSLLYLYISLGCVWCGKIFLKATHSTVFSLSIFVLFVFSLGESALNMIMLKDVAQWQKIICDALLFSLTNAIPLPLIFGILKRLSF